MSVYLFVLSRYDFLCQKSMKKYTKIPRKYYSIFTFFFGLVNAVKILAISFNLQKTLPGNLFLSVHSLLKYSFNYTCQHVLIYRRDIFLLRVPEFFVGLCDTQECPKTSKALHTLHTLLLLTIYININSNNH